MKQLKDVASLPRSLVTVEAVAVPPKERRLLAFIDSAPQPGSRSKIGWRHFTVLKRETSSVAVKNAKTRELLVTPSVKASRDQTLAAAVCMSLAMDLRFAVVGVVTKVPT